MPVTEQYQDVYVRGRTLSRGVRDCESRYRAIERSVLDHYKRPITVFDLGAAQGYFSFRIAAEHDAVVVMADDNPELASLCRANALPGTILLERRLSVDDLRELARCEHFDLVLALNVLHHFDDFQGAFEAVLALGDNVIVETPSVEDVSACGYAAVPALLRLIEAESAVEIARTPSHTNPTLRSMVRFERSRRGLTVPYFNAPPDVRGCDVRIIRDYEKKAVWIPRKDEWRGWIPGVNLRTYLELDGVWPERRAIAEWARACEPIGHGDVRPWNFILDGAAVHLIDAGDDRGVDTDDAESLKAVVAEVAGA